jgi:nicotinamidase-related amidase
MTIIGTRMVREDKTARQLFEEVMANPARSKFGFGEKLAIVNIDFQNAYTRIDEFKTAYETDPRQIEYVNTISALARAKGMPVVWTHVAYAEDASDAGVWGTRTNTPDSLQNIKYDSRRHAFDDRCEIDPAKDTVYTKRMPSPFFETPLQSLLVWHKVDTVVITGGSTSGCVRATVVEGLCCGFRVIVPVECTADRHEGPHFANLHDMAVKYADVLPVEEVLAGLAAMPAA